MRDWVELIWDALREIRAHKLRSLLTLSGIVFGAASVVSMTSLAAAMKTLVYEDLIAMGLSRSFFIRDEGPRSDAKGATGTRHPERAHLSSRAAARDLRCVPRGRAGYRVGREDPRSRSG